MPKPGVLQQLYIYSDTLCGKIIIEKILIQVGGSALIVCSGGWLEFIKLDYKTIFNKTIAEKESEHTSVCDIHIYLKLIHTWRINILKITFIHICAVTTKSNVTLRLQQEKMHQSLGCYSWPLLCVFTTILTSNTFQGSDHSSRYIQKSSLIKALFPFNLTEQRLEMFGNFFHF